MLFWIRLKLCRTMHRDVNGPLSALVKGAVINEQWRWRGESLSSSENYNGCCVGKSVFFWSGFIAQMSGFLNSLLAGIGVRGILDVQITEHVLLFEFSSTGELRTGCKRGSC